MAGRRLIYLTALGAVLVFFTAYQEWFGYLALLIILGLPWFSLLLSLPAMLSFRVEIHCPGRVNRGVETQPRLVGWCRFPAPPFRGRVRVVHPITGEEWLQKTDLPLPTDHCGGLKVTPERVWVCDYLGLFAFPVRKREGRRIIVKPEPVPVRVLPRLERFLARSWRPKAGGGFAENHELRLYRPGDGLNQVHWKLSSKMGKLIIREPMQPERGLVLLTMNLRGSPSELDRKFGRLLWLGNKLLEKEVAFEIRVLTGEGVQSSPVATQQELLAAVEALLFQPPTPEGDLRDKPFRASWQYHIGGEADET